MAVARGAHRDWAFRESGFVYRRCYGFRSCAFQRFIRLAYLINDVFVRAYRMILDSTISVECVGIFSVAIGLHIFISGEIQNLYFK